MKAPVTEASAVCAWCGVPLAPPAGRGRPRRYCSSRCRAAAYRSRSRAWSFLSEEAPPLAFAADAELLGLGQGVPRPEEATAESVSETVLTAIFVCAELRRHSVAAAPPLAARCGAVAEALDAALAHEFGPLLAAGHKQRDPESPPERS